MTSTFQRRAVRRSPHLYDRSTDEMIAGIRRGCEVTASYLGHFKSRVSCSFVLDVWSNEHTRAKISTFQNGEIDIVSVEEQEKAGGVVGARADKARASRNCRSGQVTAQPLKFKTNTPCMKGDRSKTECQPAQAEAVLASSQREAGRND